MCVTRVMFYHDVEFDTLTQVFRLSIFLKL